MKILRLPRIDRADLSAACAGLLLALPLLWPYSRIMAALAWFALVPLLVSVQEQPWRRGHIAGIFFFTPVLYWLNHVMMHFGGLNPVVAFALYLLLVVYLASFWAGACWCSARIVRFTAVPLWVVFPLVWVGMEYLRSHMLTGFPWGSIIYTQAALPVLVQSADLGGIWLPMLVLVGANTVLALTYVSLKQRKLNPGLRSAWISMALLLGANLLYGIHAMDLHGNTRTDAGAREGVNRLDLALIQANIDQDQKWLISSRAATMQLYTDMSNANADVDLIVWPESATPFYYQDNRSRYSAVVDDIARRHGVELLFGSPARVRLKQGYSYLNSAYLLDRRGMVAGRSDKVHLVPFGEYVPLGTILWFVDKMAAGVGDFRPGEMNLLPVCGHPAGVLICYEAIFPELARTQVYHGAQLLFNLTNDAWFGDTPAPHQHLNMVRFRAIENRRWVARCANTGVSALIDPAGNVHGARDIFTAGVVKGTVSFEAYKTMYTCHGDILPRLALFLLLGWMWQSRKKRLSA